MRRQGHVTGLAATMTTVAMALGSAVAVGDLRILAANISLIRNGLQFSPGTTIFVSSLYRDPSRHQEPHGGAAARPFVTNAETLYRISAGAAVLLAASDPEHATIIDAPSGETAELLAGVSIADYVEDIAAVVSGSGTEPQTTPSVITDILTAAMIAHLDPSSRGQTLFALNSNFCGNESSVSNRLERAVLGDTARTQQSDSSLLCGASISPTASLFCPSVELWLSVQFPLCRAAAQVRRSRIERRHYR